MLTIDEFEKVWPELIDKYKLKSNTFLVQAYEVRHKWAKPYFSEVFCAKQTSMQRSENANHLLKCYVPPACSMNVFIKQYQKLQHDREMEESFQHKRSLLAGTVLKLNNPIEVHASKIYTRTMYEMFGKFLFESGYYRVEVVEENVKYNTRHRNFDLKERWSRGVYAVTVLNNAEKFVCECGQFEHMGMPCAHMLKVMIHMDLSYIPNDHIMKRWTLDARDILPADIKHYERGNGALRSNSFRHSTLYTKALQVVMLGDSNEDSFEIVVDGLDNLKEKLNPYANLKDGRGLLDKIQGKKHSVSPEIAVMTDDNGG